MRVDLVTGAAIIGLASAALAAAPSASPSPSASARRSAGSAVATIGERSVSLAQVQARVDALGGAMVAPEQPGWERAFFDEVVAPELRLDAEVARRKLAEASAAAPLKQAVLVAAMERAIEREVVASGAVSDAKLRTYYDAHSDRYHEPLRLHLWRIRLADEAMARKILKEVRHRYGVYKWQDHAQKRSTDAATRYRGGDLGMVRPDGLTGVPRVKVDPALYRAARSVSDGELVPMPVKEGDHVAVIWRRGSLPPTSRSFEEVKPELRRLLLHRAAVERRKKLLEQLRGRVTFHKGRLGLLSKVPLPLPSASVAKPSRGLTSAEAAPAPSQRTPGDLLR